MSWLKWLGLAVTITGIAAVTGIKPNGNRQRRQARLGFLSPVSFERWIYEKRLVT